MIDAIVGILHHLPGNKTKCVLIARYKDTILGIDDPEHEPNYNSSDWKPSSSYVTVHDEIPDLHLQHFRQESRHVDASPELVYERQIDDGTNGNWQSFGYFLSNFGCLRKHPIKRCPGNRRFVTGA